MRIGPVLTVSNFTWASVARYIIWLETYLGLEDIDAGRVYSFGLGSGSSDNALRRKIATRDRIARNQARIMRYVKETCDNGGETETVVMHSMYLQLDVMLEVVVGHVARLNEMSRKRQADASDDVLF